MQIINLKKRFDRHENLTEYLKNEQKKEKINSKEIEIIYDLQAGAYTKNFEAIENTRNYYNNYASEIIEHLEKLPITPASILEAGVGEATTLTHVLKKLNLPKLTSYGLDISWSRLKYAEKFLLKNNIQNFNLCTGDLNSLPFSDDSFDIVYTSHSIEPNGGNEKEIIKELYRITKKYLILLEPSYELASSEGKLRMDKLGYCKNIEMHCKNLNLKVITHQKMNNVAREENITTITIIEKKSKTSDTKKHIYQCPETKQELLQKDNFLYNDYYIYPIIMNIPALNRNNKILATKINEFKDT